MARIHDSTELKKIRDTLLSYGPGRAKITAPRFELSSTVLTLIRGLLAQGAAVYAGAYTINQPGNDFALSINKTGTGAGNALKILDNGSYAGLFIDKNSAAAAFYIDKDGASGQSLYVDHASAGSPLAYLLCSVNNDVIQIAKTGAGAGDCIAIDNDGTGDGISIDQASGVPLRLTGAGGDRIVISTPHTPASASEAAPAGVICWDADYMYVTTDTNTWVRSAIATW
jgi:hypothetical protein